MTQDLRELRFAVAATWVTDSSLRARVLHRRACCVESEQATEFAITLYLAVVTSEEAGDPLAAAMARVEQAAACGVGTLEEEHRASWQRFWEASFVALPPEKDYLENLWYLTSYHLGSCCKGRYPPNHINALWSWNRDVRPWAHYYHW